MAINFLKTLQSLLPGGQSAGLYYNSPENALYGDSNYYEPSLRYGPYSQSYGPVAGGQVAGNTVSDYLSGNKRPEGSVMVSGQRTLDSRGGTDINQQLIRDLLKTQGGSSPDGQQDTGAGTTGGQSVTPPPYLQYFEGNYYTNPADYYQAVVQSVMGEAGNLRNRAQEDYGRSKKTFLEQIEELFGDLGRQEERGQRDIAGYYNSLGDIYQSSQGTRENEFASEVGRERSRIGKSKDEQLTALDRQLNDYLEGLDKSAKEGIDKTVAQGLQKRADLSPNQSFAYSAPGSANISALPEQLRSLDQFLSPQNIRRYRQPSSTSNDVYGYLNPLG